MAITPEQKEAAELQQWTAAQERARHVRLVAGPGTGKSRTIEKRVKQVLDDGADPEKVFVISFTRATCKELGQRIIRFCDQTSHATSVRQISVCTMHSLALRILRAANLLNVYPSDPVVLDDWEQTHIYDDEMAAMLGCKRKRASEIRLAYDARWQTLDPDLVAQHEIQPDEVAGFTTFHGTRTNLYCCVLPGEVIFKCVDHFELGNMPLDALPEIEHLIVDEFQDLNSCDQEFVRYLCDRGAHLFVAGDDDQSIYSFRHANPYGLINFTTDYENAVSHALTDCFRCAPSILGPASRLIAHNPDRLPKTLNALYGDALPPVRGTLNVWSFASGEQEAEAIAASCQQLIEQGMEEDQILILLSQANPPALQLNPITQALSNLGIPFAEPSGASLTEDPALHAVALMLRLVRDKEGDKHDYPAHRALLALLSGVGDRTLRELANDCVATNKNFRELFHSATLPGWLTGRKAGAVTRVRAVIAMIADWAQTDSLVDRLSTVSGILSNFIFSGPGQSAEPVANWLAFAGQLPQQMTLGELLDYLTSRALDREAILARVTARLSGETGEEPPSPLDRRVRILTMHGAKGLSGRVVFIPSVSQGILPSKRSLQAPGLVIEARRLFYVSMTRAQAACIISHAVQVTGAGAHALAQKPLVRLSRSQFLNEIGIPSANRSTGLTTQEAVRIIEDVKNL